MDNNIILGIDVGGSGIKGALVDVKNGVLITDRFRLPTPKPATPENVAAVFGEVVKNFKYKGPIGCGFPAVVKNGVAFSAANIHENWIGTNAAKLFSDISSCPVFVLNDADAAGMAEMTFGSGKGVNGTVIMITIGTGLGSAIFTDGHLVTNSEFGHVYLKGKKIVAEKFASDAVRENEELSWEKWGKRFRKYLEHLQFLFTPDLFILGGGASKNFPLFKEELKIRTPVVTAKLLNEAGIIGAAVQAYKLSK